MRLIAGTPSECRAIDIEGGALVLAGGEQDVELAGVGLVRDGGGEGEELVGGVAHRGHDDDELASRSSRSRAMRRATRLMRSAPATDEPPNFMTTRGLGMAGILAEGPRKPGRARAVRRRVPEPRPVAAPRPARDRIRPAPGRALTPRIRAGPATDRAHPVSGRRLPSTGRIQRPGRTPPVRSPGPIAGYGTRRCAVRSRAAPDVWLARDGSFESGGPAHRSDPGARTRTR